MEVKPQIVVDEAWTARDLSWLQSALVSPLDEAKKAEFLKNAREAFLESAQAIAEEAFRLGLAYGRRNP